jgi:hypothetical protein
MVPLQPQGIVNEHKTSELNKWSAVEAYFVSAATVTQKGIVNKKEK